MSGCPGEMVRAITWGRDPVPDAALEQAMPEEEEQDGEAVAVVAWGAGRNLGRLGPLSC